MCVEGNALGGKHQVQSKILIFVLGDSGLWSLILIFTE